MEKHIFMCVLLMNSVYTVIYGVNYSNNNAVLDKKL